MVGADQPKNRIPTSPTAFYDPDDPKSADLAEPWRLCAGPVIATLLYGAVLYYAFLA